MPTIQITEYTDPACPFAWSAEPSRRRVEWLYGDQFTIEPRMVGLSENVAEQEAKGFTPERLAAGAGRLAHAYHMPMDTAPRPRLAASVPACRAVVATRVNAPERERAVLRALRVRSFRGGLLDDPATLRGAASDAGLDPDELEDWLADPATEQALRDDMRAARSPSPAALALAHKLASTPDGGHRYTCPSWELSADGQSLSVPGFQPTAAYEVAIANLVPGLARRADPQDVAEVLRWAGEPLATVEVAEVCGLELDEARERLGRVATEDHVGFEGLWSLRETSTG
jgi:predicted DsbA family dithiol-disulfide isomerase